MLVIARNHRSGAERRVASWLESWTGRHKIPGVALTNCYVSGREVDLVIVTPFTTVVAEVKGVAQEITSGVLTCSPNSPWRVAGYDGDPVTVRVQDETPYDQARDCAIALNRTAKPTGGGGFVTGLVLVVPPRKSTLQLVQSSPPPQGCDALLCHDQNPLRAWFHRAHHKSCAIWTAEQVYSLVEALDFDDRVSLTALIDEGFPALPEQSRAPVHPAAESGIPPPPIPASAPARSVETPTLPGTDAAPPHPRPAPATPGRAPGVPAATRIAAAPATAERKPDHTASPPAVPAEPSDQAGTAPPPIPAAAPTRSAETPTPPDPVPTPAQPQPSPGPPTPARPGPAAAAAATQIDSAPVTPADRPPDHTASPPAVPAEPSDQAGTASPPTASEPSDDPDTTSPPSSPLDRTPRPGTAPSLSAPPGPPHLSGISAPAPPHRPGSGPALHAALPQKHTAPAADAAAADPQPPTPSDQVHPFRQPAADQDIHDTPAADPTAEQRRRGWSQTAAAFAAIAVLGTGLWLVGQARSSAGNAERTTENSPILSIVEQPPAAVERPSGAGGRPPATAPHPPTTAPTPAVNCYPFQPDC